MKCPKCSFVSFDYLSECKKCGKDLGPFKAEMGIDFVKPQALGILQFYENGGTATAVEVEEDILDTEETVAKASESKGGGAALSADDLLSEIEGGSETAVAAPEEEGGISFSLPDDMEGAAAPAAVEDSGGIALGGLDSGTPEEGISLDLGDGDIGMDLELGADETQLAQTPAAAAPAPAPQEEGGISFDLDLGGEPAVSLGGDDELSLDLGDVEPGDAVSLDAGGGPEIAVTESGDLGGLDLDLSGDEGVSLKADEEVGLDLSLGSDEETAAMGGVELDLGTAGSEEQGLDLSLGEEPSVSLDLSTELSGDAGTQEIALGGLGDLDLGLEGDAIDLGGLGSEGPAKDKKSESDGLDDLDLQLDDDDVKLG